MDEGRKGLYDEIGRSIGRTPLVEFEGSVPNGSKILIKRECDNPFGSHYDRVYLALFMHYEEAGDIRPGDKVFENTSGAAGVSFAGIGKRLGYDCWVAMPAGGEKAREEAILEQLPCEDHLILTPADKYIGGFPAFLREFLPRNRDKFYLNHSMGPKRTNNEATLRALEGIANEVMGAGMDIAYFVPAVGNGSSVLGPGRVFREVNSRVIGGATKIIGFESFQSAVAYELMHPGEYEKMFGIKPGTLSRHRLPGTSFQGIDFPHIRNAVEGKIIDEVRLVSDARMDEEYASIKGAVSAIRDLPHWDTEATGLYDFGRSTRAGIAVALDMARVVEGKNFLVIGYDKAERYDS